MIFTLVECPVIFRVWGFKFGLIGSNNEIQSLKTTLVLNLTITAHVLPINCTDNRIVYLFYFISFYFISFYFIVFVCLFLSFFNGRTENILLTIISA